MQDAIVTTDSGQEFAVDYDLRMGKDWRIRMRYDATWKEWQTAVGMKDGESFWYTVPTFPEAVLRFEEEYSSFLDRVEQVHRVMIHTGRNLKQMKTLRGRTTIWENSHNIYFT